MCLTDEINLQTQPLDLATSQLRGRQSPSRSEEIDFKSLSELVYFLRRLVPEEAARRRAACNSLTIYFSSNYFGCHLKISDATLAFPVSLSFPIFLVSDTALLRERCAG